MLRSHRWSNHCDNACWFPFFWTNHKTGQWCSSKQMFCIALLFRLRIFFFIWFLSFGFVGDSNLVSSFVFRYFIGRFSLCRSFNIWDGCNGVHDVCNGSVSSYKLHILRSLLFLTSPFYFFFCAFSLLFSFIPFSTVTILFSCTKLDYKISRIKPNESAKR